MTHTHFFVFSFLRTVFQWKRKTFFFLIFSIKHYLNLWCGGWMCIRLISLVLFFGQKYNIFDHKITPQINTYNCWKKLWGIRNMQTNKWLVRSVYQTNIIPIPDTQSKYTHIYINIYIHNIMQYHMILWYYNIL